MLEGFDQTELLEYIEGEIDARGSRALEGRLADDPGAQRHIERLRADRAGLQAMPEPELPMDFLSVLEPQLARPLLTGYRPGEYRRRFRPRLPVRRVFGLAAAAVVLLVIGAGMWATVDLLRSRAGDDSSAVVVAPPAPSGSEVTQRPRGVDEPGSEDPRWPPAGSVVHHYGPVLVDSVPPGTDAAGGVAAGPDAADGPESPVVAPFAVVVGGGELPVVERRIVQVLRSLDPEADSQRSARVAFVRNFSYDEAQALLARVEPNRAWNMEGPPAVTSSSGSEGSSLTGTAEERQRRLREAARRLRQIGPEPIETDGMMRSRRLIGARRLEPSYECQLEFASVGAMHTIAVPASEIGRLCELLYGTPVLSSALRSLPPEGRAAGAGDGEDAASWVQSMREVRAFLQRLQASESGGGMVLIPVIVTGEG